MTDSLRFNAGQTGPAMPPAVRPGHYNDQLPAYPLPHAPALPPVWHQSAPQAPQQHAVSQPAPPPQLPPPPAFLTGPVPRVTPASPPAAQSPALVPPAAPASFASAPLPPLPPFLQAPSPSASTPTAAPAPAAHAPVSAPTQIDVVPPAAELWNEAATDADANALADSRAEEQAPAEADAAIEPASVPLELAPAAAPVKTFAVLEQPPADPAKLAAWDAVVARTMTTASATTGRKQGNARSARRAIERALRQKQRADQQVQVAAGSKTAKDRPASRPSAGKRLIRPGVTRVASVHSDAAARRPVHSTRIVGLVGLLVAITAVIGLPALNPTAQADVAEPLTIPQSSEDGISYKVEHAATSGLDREDFKIRSMIPGYNAGSYVYTTNTLAPIQWPIPFSAPVLSYWGYRGGNFHSGLDISPPMGTPVVAISKGVVTKVDKYKNWNAYGVHIEIWHEELGLTSLYAHMMVGSTQVEKGDEVYAGQVIGKVGSTGRSTGPHLHFELHDKHGVPFDPFPWMTKHANG